MVKNTWCLLAMVLLIGKFNTTKAQNYYAAIAVSPSSGAYGWANNYQTQDSAKAEALRQCATVTSDCNFVAWVWNWCAILFQGELVNPCTGERTGRRGSWAGVYRSIEVAATFARKDCECRAVGCQMSLTLCAGNGESGENGGGASYT